MGKALSPELKQRIADYLRSHTTTIKATAKRFKVGYGTVHNISAESLGIEPKRKTKPCVPIYEPTRKQIAEAAAELKRKHLAEKRAGAGASPTCEFRGRVFKTMRQGRTGISYLCG